MVLLADKATGREHRVLARSARRSPAAAAGLRKLLTVDRAPGLEAAMAAVGAAGERLHEVISADCPDLIYTCEEIELRRKVFIHR
jgi:hypothetical protein